MRIRYRYIVACAAMFCFALPAFAQLTWSTPLPVNTDYRVDERRDANLQGGPKLATDGKGNWIAVWDAEPDFGASQTPFGLDYDIYFSTSPDNGQTWTAHGLLN